MKLQFVALAAAVVAMAALVFMLQNGSGLTEADAIALAKTKYPELERYPCSPDVCDGLGDLPRYISSMNKDGIYYLAFIQTGSGLPITGAKCLEVRPNGEVAEIGEYKPSSGIKMNISPLSCS